MRQLTTQIAGATATGTFVTYAKLFIPANSWADHKLIRCSFIADLTSSTAGPVPGYTVAEQVISSQWPTVPLLTGGAHTHTSHHTRFWREFAFFRDGNTLTVINIPNATLLWSFDNHDNIDHCPAVTLPVGSFDMSVQTTIELQCKLPLSDPTAVMTPSNLNAFIESPVNLGYANR